MAVLEAITRPLRPYAQAWRASLALVVLTTLTACDAEDDPDPEDILAFRSPYAGTYILRLRAFCVNEVLHGSWVLELQAEKFADKIRLESHAPEFPSRVQLTPTDEGEGRYGVKPFEIALDPSSYLLELRVDESNFGECTATSCEGVEFYGELEFVSGDIIETCEMRALGRLFAYNG